MVDTQGGLNQEDLKMQNANEEHRWQWKWACSWAGFLSLFLIATFWGTASEMFEIWWNIPTFNHCLLIVPMAAYVVYERRIIFKQILPTPSLGGAFIIFSSSLLWLLGDVVNINIFRHFGLVLMFQGVLFTVFGTKVIRAFLFPFLYLFLLVPFGDFLIPFLQEFTKDFILVILDIFDIPVYVEGLFLTIPEGKFHVAQACAGLRFMVATFALGLLMSNLIYKTRERQIVVVVLSILVPLIANGIRAAGLVLIGHYWGIEYATGVDHLVYGWVFFAVVLLVFIGISVVFANRNIHDSYINLEDPYWLSNKASKFTKYFKISIFAMILIMLAPVYSTIMSDRYKNIKEEKISLKPINNWQEIKKDKLWKPIFVGHSQEIFKKYQSHKNQKVDLYTAFFLYQDENHELIRWGNKIANPPWEISFYGQETIQINEKIYNIGVNILHLKGQYRLVYYWYIVDDQIESKDYKVKILGMKAKLLSGNLESFVFAISTDMDTSDENIAKSTLKDFMKELPHLTRMIQKQ